MHKDTYREAILKMIRDGDAKICCIACGESDRSVIELHHVFGRKLSWLEVPLCKNCHAKITAEQNKLPPKDRKGCPFIGVSIGALAVVWGQQCIDQAHKGVDT
ncbi:hypothetical protein SZ63_11745 [Methanoculleus sediminis]|uniref:Uncharacterized protein n=1 Tax=Methanoculleus sediminis TaxID=1550566 RepID=A0A0H1R3B7_9EURY|nr:hypothetical protein [Methanoculleus sediminis]KLK87257.1 hypothetical protein SZ63_11745 [Methanoculleus sediminis]